MTIRIPNHCATCGKKIPYRRKFCSMGCMGEWIKQQKEPEPKVCLVCGAKITAKGKQRYCSEECQKMGAEIKKRSGKVYRDALKKEGCCVCGYNKTPFSIDFHHVSSKDKNMARLHKIEDINSEILKNKVVLMCANCHREFHAGLIQLPKDAPRVIPIPGYSPVKEWHSKHRNQGEG